MEHALILSDRTAMLCLQKSKLHLVEVWPENILERTDSSLSISLLRLRYVCHPKPLCGRILNHIRVRIVLIHRISHYSGACPKHTSPPPCIPIQKIGRAELKLQLVVWGPPWWQEYQGENDRHYILYTFLPQKTSICSQCDQAWRLRVGSDPSIAILCSRKHSVHPVVPTLRV